MNEKIFKDTEDPNDTRSADDILNDGMFSLSNISNMISVSTNPNMYMSGIANLPNINSDDPLKESPEDKKFS
ncbi:hypothetical protein [Clostridium sp.]|uniref:hypothetical protein n=1 Tax=Clostridium sp. TaxID=1506 RepID=UPI003D6CCBBA